MKRRHALAVLTLAAAAALADPAVAQAWPDKPIRFVMTAPAGSSIDVLGRTIADKLKDRLGQPVIVDNKPAAGGTVAVAEVAKSAPDGYTMVLGFNGPLAFGPLLQKLPYDVAKDLAPVIITSSQPNVLAVNAAAAGEQPEGADRLRQGEPGQAQLRVFRHRHHRASERRIAETGGRHRSRAYSLQRQRRRDA